MNVRRKHVMQRVRCALLLLAGLGTLLTFVGPAAAASAYSCAAADFASPDDPRADALVDNGARARTLLGFAPDHDSTTPAGASPAPDAQRAAPAIAAAPRSASARAGTPIYLVTRRLRL